MRPITVRSNDGLIHSVFSQGHETLSICGVFYAREKRASSQAITCLWCASNKRAPYAEAEA